MQPQSLFPAVPTQPRVRPGGVLRSDPNGEASSSTDATRRYRALSRKWYRCAASWDVSAEVWLDLGNHEEAAKCRVLAAQRREWAREDALKARQLPTS